MQGSTGTRFGNEIKSLSPTIATDALMGSLVEQAGQRSSI